MPGFFITGTDTGVGKTYTTCWLLRQLQALNYSAAGVKPLASGAVLTARGQWQNEDVLALQQYSSRQANGELFLYDALNAYTLHEPVAPHIAAAQQGITLELAPMLARVHQVSQQVDYVLVEGVGGWFVPLHYPETMADVARRLNWPVLLVVGLRLGCLNHALLTQHAILSSGVPFAGWIGNVIDPSFAYLAENVQTLKQFLQAPYLGQLPYDTQADPVYHLATRWVAGCIQLPSL